MPGPSDVHDVRMLPQDGAALLALYDRALPEVYGYLISRCGDRALAEDLTSETFLAAVTAQGDGPCTVGWLIGVARHKLADHWRWKARQERLLDSVAAGVAADEDWWDAQLDVLRAQSVLDRLTTTHRAVLTLRYLDGCSVAEIADLLGRTVHAAEALLVRASRAFRHEYEGSTDV
jgi:RNA polymerase sigma-70 factor (ECF subfamily)